MNRSTEFVPFALPSIGPEEEIAVLEVLRSGWLTTGKVARAFEEEFASFVGAARALAVNSATSGLHLALEAFGVGPGGQGGHEPLHLRERRAAVAASRRRGRLLRHLRARTTTSIPSASTSSSRAILIRAVIPVHVGGMPCHMAEILGIVPPPRRPGRRGRGPRLSPALAEGFAGTLGDAGVYSFYATKTITTGEGGMVVGARRGWRWIACRPCASTASTRRPGTATPPGRRPGATTSSEAGYKYNLPDLLAAVGREQLKKADRFLEERRAIADRYLEAFGGQPAFERRPSIRSHAWHLFSLRLRRGTLRIGRDDFVERLRRSGIGVSVHFIPLHMMSYWSKRYSLRTEDFPEAYAKYSRTISLPIWQGMSGAQVERVVERVLETAEETRILAMKRTREPGPRSIAPWRVGDFKAEGMLYVATVRSPVARGSVRSIAFPDCPRATGRYSPRTFPDGTRIVSFGAEVPILAQRKSFLRGGAGSPGRGARPRPPRGARGVDEGRLRRGGALLNWESFSSEQVAAKRVAVVGDPDLAFSIASSVHEETTRAAPSSITTASPRARPRPTTTTRSPSGARRSGPITCATPSPSPSAAAPKKCP